MKIVERITLLSVGPFSHSDYWLKRIKEIEDAVCVAEWPPGTGSFTIPPLRKGNGVKPIKDASILTLVPSGRKYSDERKARGADIRNEWTAETPWPSGGGAKLGNMDAAYLGDEGVVCFEWETGNISSSHRSLNKMCLGLYEGILKAGVLVVPSQALYPYLTDRIGNVGELRPYFPLWSSIPIKEGVLEIIVFEHDELDEMIIPIPKGTDGRALI